VSLTNCVRRFSTRTTGFAGKFFFANEKGGHFRDTDTFNAAWRDAHNRKRIPYRDPYKCRHTRAAELLSIGIEPADAAKQLGHSPEMFLQTYAEFIEEFSKSRDRTRFEGIASSVGKSLANSKK
jgi:integrase